MKVFRDLSFTGPPDQLQNLIDAIEAKLEDGWRRAEEMESRPMQPDDIYAFACDSQADRQAAALFLFQRGSKELYVSNIVPSEAGQLSHDEYNSILLQFYESYAKPAVEEIGIEDKLTPGERDIGDWIPDNPLSKLKSFSRSANKSTGSSHPTDQKRWFGFVISMHQENATLNSDTLTRWLKESQGWPDDMANRLAVEYERGRNLLSQYDEVTA